MVWVHAHLYFEDMLNIVYYIKWTTMLMYNNHGDLSNITVPGAQGSTK